MAARIQAPILTGYQQTFSVVVDPGGSWSATLEKNEIVRFVDLEGRQAVDFLCYNSANITDRYNAANTMKMAANVYLNKGTILYGELATPLMVLRDTSCPNHDTIGGCCSVEMNFIRYGRRTHSCRANFLHELTKHNMVASDIVANVNFFMSVPILLDGGMAISESPSRAGDYVDVEACTDVLIAISNCPQKYNPACGYNPTPIRAELYRKAGRPRKSNFGEGRMRMPIARGNPPGI